MCFDGLFFGSEQEGQYNEILERAKDFVTGLQYGADGTDRSDRSYGSAGLYYYYHTFAASLKAAGIDEVEDRDGRVHDWRADLVRELSSRQLEEGARSNDNARWFENDKNLATSFALLALSDCDNSAAGDGGR